MELRYRYSFTFPNSAIENADGIQSQLWVEILDPSQPISRDTVWFRTRDYITDTVMFSDIAIENPWLETDFWYAIENPWSSPIATRVNFGIRNKNVWF